MTPKDQDQQQEREYGTHFKPEVKNVITLTLAFAKATANNQSDKTDNLVVSPYNALACLTMVAKGADHETRAEMASTLFGTDGNGLDAAAAAYGQLNADILKANQDQVEMITAYGVWTNQALVKLRQSYADDLKAPWTHKFDKSLTEDRSFVGDGTQAVVTPTMHQEFSEGLKYLAGRDFEAVALTYGEKKYTDNGSKYPTMRIVLVRPTDAAVNARDWLVNQHAGKVPVWLDPWSYQEANGTVELPRLDIEQEHNIIPPLKDLGIRAAFQGGVADFTRMVEAGGDRIYVSKVSHSVVFKTDEEGSEAAAVTAMTFTLESCGPEPVKVDVKFNRSFVFALQDIQSGAVLFVGAVNKPNNEMKPVKASALAPKL